MSQGIKLLIALKEKIYSTLFCNSHKKGNSSFSRVRKLAFPTVFSMVLKLVTKSLGVECELLDTNPDNIPPSKQAFSKARYKISHTGFQELLDTSIEIHYEDPTYGTWRNYRLIAADGSSIRLPESDEVISKFSRFKCNKQAEKQPILARVSLFVDLCTSVILSGKIESWNVGEQRLAEKQLYDVTTRLRELGQDKFLFIYDRGYPSFKFIKQHYDLGSDFLMRLQRGMYKKLWQRVRFGARDFDFNRRCCINDFH